MNFDLVLGSNHTVLAFALPVAALIGIRTACLWQPARKFLPYAMTLAIAGRALSAMLFAADPFSILGFILDGYCILMAAGLGYRYTLSSRLARQYPWIYRRFLVFWWRGVRSTSQTAAAAVPDRVAD